MNKYYVFVYHLVDMRLGALGARRRSLFCARRPTVGTLIRIGQTFCHPNLPVPKFTDKSRYIFTIMSYKRRD